MFTPTNHGQGWQGNDAEFALASVDRVAGIPDGLELVRPGGTFVSIPTLVDDGDIPAAEVDGAEKGVARVFSSMDDVNCSVTLEQIAELIVSGDVVLPTLTEFALQDEGEAHRILQEGHNRGKMALKVADLG